MRISRALTGWAALLFLLVSRAPALAQITPPPIQGVTTAIPGLTVADTITQLVKPVGATHVGEALGLATQLEVATAPFGAAPSGFVIKLDPSTGLQVRTATTFGPFFAENALTTGEGNVSVGVNFTSASYDRLGSFAVNGLQLRSVAAASPTNARSGVANLSLTANTLVVSGRMGVTDKLDIGVALPIVTVKLNGTSSLANGNGDMILFASGNGVASGLGDVAGQIKYRFLAFGAGQPDPGGMAVMATVRLPTGDKENLRGLGVTRTLVSFIASSGQGRFRPHGNVGFEYWSKGVGVASDYAQNGSVTARHQLAYAAGFELEAAPKVTLIADLLGRQIFGGGRVDVVADPSTAPGAVSSSSAVALPEGISKLALAPGLKVNLKSKLLLSVNVLIALRDTGLHARVTPVAGIEMAFK
ncbi:MAG: hypothetical protein ABJA98_13755 [Acidobacteriota bacterium]